MAQGFPDWETPLFVKEALNNATKANENQYIRCGGHLSLVNAIATEYSEKFNREINALTEVTVANGATGILANAYCSFVEPGDEVIVFEPGFEFHWVDALIFGAKISSMPLTPPQGDSVQWKIDFEKLETVFNEKTRIIVLNNPHNPTGKVLQQWEIEKLIEILQKFPRVIVLSDEVRFFWSISNCIRYMSTCIMEIIKISELDLTQECGIEHFLSIAWEKYS